MTADEHELPTGPDALRLLNRAGRFLDWRLGTRIVDGTVTGPFVAAVITISPRQRRKDGTVGHRRAAPLYTDPYVMVDSAVIEAAVIARRLFPELDETPT